MLPIIIAIFYKCNPWEAVFIIDIYIANMTIDVRPIIKKTESGIKGTTRRCIANAINPNKSIMLWINSANALGYRKYL